MTIVTTLPWSRLMTADDYVAWEPPNDGQRYELIAGVLVVSPSPLVPHQEVQSEVLRCLFRDQLPEFKVYAAPMDVRLSERTVVQPDIVVVRSEDARGDRLTGIPVLVVELLSDSTRGNDLLLKRARYEAAGIPSYWIIEPRSREFTLLDMDSSGRYAATHTGVLGPEPVVVDLPYPVRLMLPD